MNISPKWINNICFFLHPKYIWPTLFQVWTDPLNKDFFYIKYQICIGHNYIYIFFLSVFSIRIFRMNYFENHLPFRYDDTILGFSDPYIAVQELFPSRPHKLIQMCRHFNISVDEDAAHNALYDSLMLKDLIREIFRTSTSYSHQNEFLRQYSKTIEDITL